MILASLHGIWRCWVYFEFRFMQIVVNKSSSMKPVDVLNNFTQNYYLLPCFERCSTQGRYGKGAGKFFVKWLSRLIRLHR